jgi:protoporphyrinogen IX oxidase
MKEFLVDHYLALKALHLMAVISWMAGIFYIPRLFVYHTETKPGAPDYDRFCLMEHRLLKIIMFPAMILTWLCGLAMAWANDWWGANWFQLKLGLVALMTWIHVTDMIWARDFALGRNRRSGRFFRFWNEFPTVLMIAIVILVVVKPF